MATPYVAEREVATALCDSGVAAGRVAYRGVAVEELIASATFEETCALLFAGRLPTVAQLADTNVRLAANRALPEPALAWLAALPRASAPLDVLRTAVSALGTFVPHLITGPPTARHALAIVAKVPSIVAAWDRLRRNLVPLAPLPGLSTAANLIYMRSGRPPAPDAERALDAVLIAFADRGVDTPAYAARVVAAAGGDAIAAVTAALAASPTGGGDPAHALAALLDGADAPESETDVGSAALATFARDVAATAEPEWRRRYAALDRASDRGARFYASAIAYGLGIAPDTIASVVACGRMAGWTAHVLEQRTGAGLPSPRFTYTGLAAVPWVAIDRRVDAAGASGRT